MGAYWGTLRGCGAGRCCRINDHPGFGLPLGIVFLLGRIQFTAHHPQPAWVGAAGPGAWDWSTSFDGHYRCLIHA